ncbi:MAG: putative DNA-binding domain-containing protein [Sulfuricurvum sp.]|nr:putative DNA-binding domain-containing protein [Sulfuricurvum sp.]
MKTETAVMERLVQIIQNNEEISNPLNNRLQVYRDMVYFRFFETLENIYPILSAKLGAELMNELVCEFISSGAKSPFITKMAEEFGHFLRHHPKLTSTLFLEDLLWFEYGELELLSRDFNDTHARLEWSQHYKLSSSSLLRNLSYKVHTGEFESPCVSSLLLYYHFDEKRVYFEEITPFAQQLVEKLENLTLESAVSTLAEMYELDVETLRQSVRILVEKWCNQRVLIKFTEV